MKMGNGLIKKLTGIGLFALGIGLFGDAYSNAQNPIDYVNVIEGFIGAGLAFYGPMIYNEH